MNSHWGPRSERMVATKSIATQERNCVLHVQRSHALPNKQQCHACASLLFSSLWPVWSPRTLNVIIIMMRVCHVNCLGAENERGEQYGFDNTAREPAHCLIKAHPQPLSAVQRSTSPKRRMGSPRNQAVHWYASTLPWHKG